MFSLLTEIRHSADAILLAAHQWAARLGDKPSLSFVNK